MPTLGVAFISNSGCRRIDNTLIEVKDDVEINRFDALESPGDIFVFDNNPVSTNGYASGTSAGRCILLEDVEIMNNLYCHIVFEFPEGMVLGTC